MIGRPVPAIILPPMDDARTRTEEMREYLELLRRGTSQDMTVAEFRLLYGDPLADKPRGTMAAGAREIQEKEPT